MFKSSPEDLTYQPELLDGDLLTAEMPINYSLDFEWGNLRVTEAANQVYDLVPLAEGIRKGDSASPATDGLVEVRLIGPDEIPEDCQSENVGLFLYARSHKGGIRIDTGFNHGRTENFELVSQAIQGAAGMSEDEFAEQIVDDETDATLPEALEQQVPQMLVHFMVSALKPAIESTFVDYMHNEMDKKTLKQLTMDGAAGLVGAAAIVAVAGPSTLVDAAAGIYLTTSLATVRRHLKGYMKTARADERLITTIAEKVADSVQGDIHATYCTRHFDEQAEELLSD